MLLAAYDDAAGVTAAFNKNVLARINRELGGHFDLDRFRHVARWNERASRIEMHLESIGAQEVTVDALGLRVRFEAGETIHTESSVKYDLPGVERLLAAGGFRLEETYQDAERRFAVHLARAAKTTVEATMTGKETPVDLSDPCSHVTSAMPRKVHRPPPGCEECLKIGGEWVHLRICLTCGHVGCCDSSPNRHATAHNREDASSDHHLGRDRRDLGVLLSRRSRALD